MNPGPTLTLFALRALCALSLVVPTAAQAVKELRLKDGRVVVGEVREEGETYRVTTADGDVTIARANVARVRSQKELQAALDAKAEGAGDSAFAHLQLARVARDYGLSTEMWRHLDKALAKLPAAGAGRPDAVTRRLRDFLAELEPQLLPTAVRQATTDKRVRAILRKCQTRTGPARSAGLLELLVREPNADKLLRQQARRGGNSRQRIAALTALQRRPTSGNDLFVLRTTVLDRNEDVRAAAAALGRPPRTPHHGPYMARGRAHPAATVRTRTAEALGALRHPAAVELLVRAGPHAGAGLAAAGDTGASRGHLAFFNQRSSIRDFDVEVASAAFIADPKIDVLQSGTVLDVTVLGVTEVRKIVHAYRSALKQLTDDDPGADPRAWAEWRARRAAAKAPAETGKR